EGKGNVQKRGSRNSLIDCADRRCRGEKRRPCAFAAEQSLEEQRTRKTAAVETSDGSILTKATAKPRQSHGHRLLPARLSSRGHRTAHNGADLAGDASIS